MHKLGKRKIIHMNMNTLYAAIELKRIKVTWHRYTHRVVPLSLDETYLDVTHNM